MPQQKTARYGIDTSIFVRLLTGHPEKDYAKTLDSLEQRLNKEPDAELFASNQVIGEAYVTLQHHYEISKADARQALITILTGSMVKPLNGAPVIDCLKAKQGCGLLDRLIAQEYASEDVRVLTNDRKMAKLPEAELL